MQAEIRDQHRWLAQLVGDWTMETVSGPGGGAEQASGTESVRLLGEAWAICESRMTTAGGESGTNIMTLGYDTARGRFVGSFISSSMTHMWVYDGSLDAAGRTLALDTTGPSFTGEGGTAPYQDRVELLGPDERVLSSWMLGQDGQWQEFMRMRYRRVTGAP